MPLFRSTSSKKARQVGRLKTPTDRIRQESESWGTLRSLVLFLNNSTRQQHTTMSSNVYTSPWPKVDLPVCSVWEKVRFASLLSSHSSLDCSLRVNFEQVWSNPKEGDDAKAAVIDGPTGRVLK